MARLRFGGRVALVMCAILAAALSGATAASTTVVSFVIDDSYPPTPGPGVYSDGTSEYADYRVDPTPRLNWCVEAEPATTGLLFIRLNRSLVGSGSGLRCSDSLDPEGHPGIPRNFTLRIANDAVCDLLADPAAELPLTDAGGLVSWDTGTSFLPCVLPSNDSPRIRVEALYKARAKTTTIDFLTKTIGAPVSYEIQADVPATITAYTNPPRKEIAYAGTFHLVRFEDRVKAKTVGPAFSMPVRMEFFTYAVQ